MIASHDCPLGISTPGASLAQGESNRWGPAAMIQGQAFQDKAPMTSQWDNIRKNLGTWEGSFTKLSPQGKQLLDTPSVLILEEEEADRIKLTLTRTAPDEAPDEMLRTFSKPGPGAIVPFLETGAFCQGSTYWSTVSQAGAELALTSPDRRLRLVLLYAGLGQGRSHLKDITLIRECRSGSGAVESPKLTVEQLVGTWKGSSVSHNAMGGISDPMVSELVMQREGDVLKQALQFGEHKIETQGRIEGDVIHFESGPQPVQVLMLPGGASANCPLQVQPNQPFFLEAGWMLDATHRQRLIRRYDDKGNWESVTLVQEEKVR